MLLFGFGEVTEWDVPSSLTTVLTIRLRSSVRKDNNRVSWILRW